MSNFIVRVVLGCSCCLFLIVACKRLPPNPCTLACASRLDACIKVCRNNCPLCTTKAAKVATEYYDHYQHEQTVKGGIIALQLNSFRDPLQCRKVTCNCKADYQVCRQSCGGIIQKQLQHALLCS